MIEAFGDAPPLALAIIPIQERSTEPLPDAIRSRFIDRIATKINEAFAGESGATVLSDAQALIAPTTQCMLSLGCSLCRGACCTRGGDHAFLTDESVQRVKRDHPEHTATTLLAAYVALLPAAHVADSCVYHDAGGCALPTTMRSNTCNRYLCRGLTELRRTLDVLPAQRVAFGLSNNEELRALVAVDADGTAETVFSAAIVG